MATSISSSRIRRLAGVSTGVKGIHHPLVGDLTLDFEKLELPADPGQTMLVYTAEPDWPSHDALTLLASWRSKPERPSLTAHADTDEI